MKKLLTLFAVVIVLAACSNQEDAMPASQTSVKNTSYIRSFDEALQIAQSSISILEGSEITRSGSTRKINLDDSKVYKQNALTRSAASANDTLMYVFNFEDNQGFAVIAANRNTDALIAVTEKGHYDPDNTSVVEGFNFYMDKVKEYLRIVPLKPIIPDSIYRDSLVIKPDYSSKVGPYVTVEWGQVQPEGELCPNNLSGCTNTACAQIMSYYEYPTSIDITYDNTPFVQNLNWSQMKNHLTQHPYSNCITQATHRSISLLHRQLGHLNHSEYTQDCGTRTYTELYVGNTMQSLGYQTGNWTPYNISEAKNQLDINHLLLIRGDVVNEDSGHAWVLDGYLPYRQYTYRLQPIGIDGAWMVTNIIPGSIVSYACHMNWGWYGECNGYYSTTPFHLNSPEFGNGIQISEVEFLPVYHSTN